MEVICLESEAFYNLVENVYKRLSAKEKVEEKWLDKEQAMRKLNIKSPTTLQKLRDEGSIRFTQPKKRVILYDNDSIMEYLDNHAKETF